MRFIFLIGDRIYFICKYTLLLCMGIIIFVISINVSCRFILNFGFPWAEEVCRYCLVWGTFLGACCGYRAHELIGMTLLIKNIPRRIRWKVGLFVEIVIASFLCFGIVYGIINTKNSMNQFSPALELSMFYILLCIPISLFFMLIFNFENIFVYLSKKEHILGDIDRID